MQKSDFIQAASLSNPFYYLENALTVWQWVLKHHCDCLCTEEIQQLQDILNLPRDAQALLVRMVMRQGELFPLGTLQYAEIENSNQAVALLEDLDGNGVNCGAAAFFLPIGVKGKQLVESNQIIVGEHELANLRFALLLVRDGDPIDADLFGGKFKKVGALVKTTA